MVGAHIDSVLGAPGAHDDATGNGVSMEIARVVGKLPLDKEIRIGGFGGEEDGLTGSHAYVAEPRQHADRGRARALRRRVADGHGRHAVRARQAVGADARRQARTSSSTRPTRPLAQPASRPCHRRLLRQLQARRQSDHQAFFDVGIPSALFIWLDYRNARSPPAPCASSRAAPTSTEPEYHTPRDGMNNVSSPSAAGDARRDRRLVRAQRDEPRRLHRQRRPQHAGRQRDRHGNCGDGVRDFGTTDAAGYLEIRVPHVTCDFTVTTAALEPDGRRRSSRRHGARRSPPRPAAPAAPCRRRCR